MRDKHSILKLAQDARKTKVNIKRHLPRAMQVQRKSTYKDSFNAIQTRKKFSGKWLAVNIAFTPTMKGGSLM